MTTYYLISRFPLSWWSSLPLLSFHKPLFHLPPKIFGCVFCYILGPEGDNLIPDQSNVYCSGTLIPYIVILLVLMLPVLSLHDIFFFL